MCSRLSAALSTEFGNASLAWERVLGTGFYLAKQVLFRKMRIKLGNSDARERLTTRWKSQNRLKFSGKLVVHPCGGHFFLIQLIVRTP